MKHDWEKLFDLIFQGGDLIEFRCLPIARSEWMEWPFRQPAAVDDWLREMNAANDIYFGVNPRWRHGGRSGVDVALSRVLVADFDDMGPAIALDAIRVVDLPFPSAVVKSGGGVHCYWAIRPDTSPILDVSGEWRTWQKRIAIATGADRKVCDPPRILRVPGTLNRKRGGVPCQLLSCLPLYRTLQSFDRIAGIDVVEDKVANRERPRPMPGVLRTVIPADLMTRVAKYVENLPPAVSGSGGHAATMWAARCVVWGFNLGAEAGFQVLLQHYNPKCSPPWSDWELWHKCIEADVKPMNKTRGWILNAERKS